jgi:phosphoglycerol transferase
MITRSISTTTGARQLVSRLQAVAPFAGQVLLVLLIMLYLLHGTRRDFRVPLGFSSDGLQAMMQCKTTIDSGWWWFNGHLSAPFSFDARLFPANTNFDQFLVWLVHLFFSDAGICANLTWILILALGAVIATLCLLHLGLSRPVAFLAGILYGISPYALYRGIDHFWMAAYLVPVPCTVALWLAAGRGNRFRRPERILLAGCVLVSLNYIYYAFFAGFLILVGTAVGFYKHRNLYVIRAGVLVMGTICVISVLNLAPSMYAWHTEGKPIVIRDKVPAEAEVYGLKIRQLVSPVFGSDFGPFRRWTEREANARYPLETENTISRLGFAATVGFLTLLVIMFIPRLASALGPEELLMDASRLNIATLLLATLGGFGSLFNLLVSPAIRAYNRICPFIAFLSLLAFAVLLQALLKRSGLSSRGWTSLALLFVLALGICDQAPAARHYNDEYPSNQLNYLALRSIVQTMESRLPRDAMVFQLPLTMYLNDSGTVRMGPYEHLKPYLVSHKLHWSYPAMTNLQVRWQQAAGRLSPAQLPGSLAGTGFSAILVDRNGYQDNGAAVLAQLNSAIGPGSVLAETERYVAFDLRVLQGREGPPIRVAPRWDASSGHLPRCGGNAPVYNLDQIGTNRGPFAGSVIAKDSGDLTVAGWAIDQEKSSAAGEVDLVLDGQPIPTLYGADRSDVSTHYGIESYRNSGFIGTIAASILSRGNHPFSVRVISADRKCYYQSPELTIVIP